jgi:hypothetical protein
VPAREDHEAHAFLGSRSPALGTGAIKRSHHVHTRTGTQPPTRTLSMLPPADGSALHGPATSTPQNAAGEICPHRQQQPQNKQSKTAATRATTAAATATATATAAAKGPQQQKQPNAAKGVNKGPQQQKQPNAAKGVKPFDGHPRGCHAQNEGRIHNNDPDVERTRAARKLGPAAQENGEGSRARAFTPGQPGVPKQTPAAPLVPFAGCPFRGAPPPPHPKRRTYLNAITTMNINCSQSISQRAGHTAPTA